MTFNEKLTATRKSRGITQRKLAEMLGITPTRLNYWEKGKTEPDLRMIRALSEALHITADELIGNVPGAALPAGLTEEAQKVGLAYAALDARGQRVVQAVLSEERKAMKPSAAPQPQQQDTADGETAEVATEEASGRPPRPRPMWNPGGFVEFEVYDEPAAAGFGNYLDAPRSHREQFPEAMIPRGADFGIRISGDSMEPQIRDGSTVFVRALPSIDSGKVGIFVLDGKSYCKQLIVDRDAREVRLHSFNPAYGDIVVGAGDSLHTVGEVL